ncbi:hypothetical protein C6Y14_09545 [Streptomyces dioscori]|uniref:Signal transduction histidine kinase subgroup 3 dimerisation and phosphoacceptor domain-containing protein n=1 Tax=Streptomyces dioscori TaxID=2109333 RepID=A0A2P8QCD0_9ACTN|nr:hypothetical protein [Streptomyces dioscori]PSM43912.1 hypothetical protein C6Y14_09545 [Streptomyces dioscori]
MRLLPWAGDDGKPCYLIGDGKGHLSRTADRIESLQLGMSAGLLDHAADLLADRRATADQLRYLAARLAEALTDVHRIAESRGARVPPPLHADARDGAGHPHIE